MEQINVIFSESFWYIAPILVTMTTMITGIINQLFKITKGILPQIVSWVVGSGLSVLAWLINLVSFNEPVWLGIICLSVVIGLASNGVYDIPTIKSRINLWFVKK